MRIRGREDRSLSLLHMHISNQVDGRRWFTTKVLLVGTRLVARAGER